MTLTNAIPVAGRHVCYLPSAIENILKQSVKPKEVIIIVSDYSSEDDDNIIEKCRELLYKNDIVPIIKTFTFAYRAGKNRSIAYDHCNTDIISFQDCDDLTHKDRNKLIITAFEQLNAAQILHGQSYNEDALDTNINYKDCTIECVDNIWTDRSVLISDVHHGAISLHMGRINYDFHFPNSKQGQDVQLVESFLDKNKEFNTEHKMYVIRDTSIYVWRKEHSSHNISDNRESKKLELLKYLGL